MVKRNVAVCFPFSPRIKHILQHYFVGGRAEVAGDAVYSNGTWTIKERKRLILSCLLAYRRARLRYFITICSINIHRYDSSYFPVHHIASHLAIGRTYVHRTSHWSNTSDTPPLQWFPLPYQKSKGNQIKVQDTVLVASLKTQSSEQNPVGKKLSENGKRVLHRKRGNETKERKRKVN